MKLSLNPILAAVGIALASTSAHAALLAPAQSSAAPVTNSLFLELSNTSGATELVNLGYTYQNIGDGSNPQSTNFANLNPTSATSPFTTQNNPTGASGQVYQLDFGTVANFATFNNANSSFMVVADAKPGTGTGASGTASLAAFAISSGSNPSVIGSLGGSTLNTNIQGEIANWNGNSVNGVGTNFDSAGATATNNQLNFLSGVVSGTAVGQAASFYNILSNSSGTAVKGGVQPASTVTTAYSGFWFLSSTGDLTYNVAAAGAPVPLPAGLWLLGSGLLGMFGVGRRRKAA